MSRGLIALCLFGLVCGCGVEDPAPARDMRLAVSARLGRLPPAQDRIELVIDADGHYRLEGELVAASDLVTALEQARSTREATLRSRISTEGWPIRTRRSNAAEAEETEETEETEELEAPIGEPEAQAPVLDPKTLTRAKLLSMARVTELRPVPIDPADGPGGRPVDLVLRIDAAASYQLVRVAVAAAAVAWINRIHYLVRTPEGQVGAIAMFLSVDACGGRRLAVTEGRILELAMRADHGGGDVASRPMLRLPAVTPDLLVVEVHPREDTPWSAIVDLVSVVLQPDLLHIAFGYSEEPVDPSERIVKAVAADRVVWQAGEQSTRYRVATSASGGVPSRDFVGRVNQPTPRATAPLELR